MSFITAVAVDAAHAHGHGSVFASLSGTVRDASGAVVPDATAVLLNLATNVEQRATTDAGGRYLFVRVTPGDYALRVEKAGFRRTVVDVVALEVNDAVSRDVTLAPGDVSETVTVSSAATGVQTRGAGVSLAVDARSINELPLNGKDWSRLLALAPGAGLTADAPVSGVRNPNNSFTIDGVGNNNERSSGQPLVGGAAFWGGPNLISTEAVQEFRVITANADATFGRASGAQVNVITKSGTNTFRGAIYELMRDDALDARDFFNHGPYLDGEGRAVVPPFEQHLFGATLGGPLQRNRHFFLASYEGLRQERQLAWFPDAKLGALWALVVTCGGTYLMAQVARVRGKEKEAKLLATFGSLPTIARLKQLDTPNPSPCSDGGGRSGICFPTSPYQLLSRSVMTPKGEPDLREHYAAVDREDSRQVQVRAAVPGELSVRIRSEPMGAKATRNRREHRIVRRRLGACLRPGSWWRHSAAHAGRWRGCPPPLTRLGVLGDTETGSCPRGSLR